MNTSKISYDKTRILPIELESKVSSICAITQDFKNCRKNITTMFTKIEHF